MEEGKKKEKKTKETIKKKKKWYSIVLSTGIKLPQFYLKTAGPDFSVGEVKQGGETGQPGWREEERKAFRVFRKMYSVPYYRIGTINTYSVYARARQYTIKCFSRVYILYDTQQRNVYEILTAIRRCTSYTYTGKGM